MFGLASSRRGSTQVKKSFGQNSCFTCIVVGHWLGFVPCPTHFFIGLLECPYNVADGFSKTEPRGRRGHFAFGGFSVILYFPGWCKSQFYSAAEGRYKELSTRQWEATVTIWEANFPIKKGVIIQDLCVCVPLSNNQIILSFSSWWWPDNCRWTSYSQTANMFYKIV